MINIYKTPMTEGAPLEEISHIEPGCWINIVAPKEQELMLVSKRTGVPLDFLRAAMDDEETSRIEIEDDIILILEDIPFTETEENSLTYDTYPLAIIHTEDLLITVCLKNSKIISDFKDGKIRTFYTYKKSRFILQILQRISTYYLQYLRQIDKKSNLIEKKVYRSMKTRELIHMLSLEKSLVYFTTSLKSNEVTLEKMLKLDFIKKYEDDEDLLEEVIIETKQAIEMASIYSDVLSRTMDAFASLINLNLSLVMKFLTAITILMEIPNLISGFFGINVPGLPFTQSPFGAGFVFLFIVALTGLAAWYLNKKNMF